MAENTVDDKVILKIRKILAIANDGANANESYAAMLKAQELMAQHGLCMTDVGQDNSPREVLKASALDSGRLLWWEKSLAAIIGQNFRCYPLIDRPCTSGCEGVSCLSFLGLADDVELAVELFKFARRRAKLLSETYVNSAMPTRGASRSLRQGLRNDYLLGFVQGVRAKFSEQVKARDWGLILVKDSAVEAEHGRLTLRRGPKNGPRQHLNDPAAIGSGYSAGYRLSPHPQKVEELEGS